MWKQSLEQIGPSGRAILDSADGASQGESVAGAQAVNPGLDVGIQTDQCKAGWVGSLI
jgi:hypothetical protein